ncbi:MAG: hypothetical protein AAF529_25380 [Pseudomonadota bacterium]
MAKDPDFDLPSLLALRDGEPLEASQLPDADGPAGVTLERLIALKQSLAQMPDVGVSEAVWQQAAPAPTQQNTGFSFGSSRWLRYPMSTAASILLLSTLSVFLLFNDRQPADIPLAAASYGDLVTGNDRLALMNRSQQLERTAYGAASWGGGAGGLQVSPMGELLLLELARVDAEIGAAQQSGLSPLDEDLWRKRVDLLQAFIAEMESQNPERFVDERSL